MKLLIVQTGFLGDTILSTPVIAALNALHPQAEIWMMTTPASKELIEKDPLLSGIIVFDKRKTERGISGILRKAKEIRKHNFDKVYCLHKSARTAIILALSKITCRVGFKQSRLRFLFTETVDRAGAHDAQRNLSILGTSCNLASLKQDLRLFEPSEKDLGSELKSIFTSCKSDYIALCPGSVWYTKRWQADKYREVAEHYIKAGRRVVLLGSPAERELAERVGEGLDVINLAGKTRVSETMLFLKHASLVICNDSMFLHMASAFKVPNVSVFCATSPEFGFGPWMNKKALVVQKTDLACKPCRRHGSNKCPTGTESCMKDLPAAEVIKAAQNLLD